MGNRSKIAMSRILRDNSLSEAQQIALNILDKGI